MTTTGAFRCARGNRCAGRIAVAGKDGEFEGAKLNEAGMCYPCQAKVAESIRRLPNDVVRLTVLIAAGGTSPGEYVNATQELRVPIRLGVDALRRRIDVELQFWAVYIAEKLGKPWDLIAQARSRQGIRVHRAAEFLAHNISHLVALPSVPHLVYDREGRPIKGSADWQSGLDGACHLLELHQRAYRVCGRTKLVHKLYPACPNCQKKTLVRENGGDFVHCESCDDKFPESHYAFFASLVAEEELERRRTDGAA